MFRSKKTRRKSGKKSKKANAQPSKQLRIEPLEPRILLSATWTDGDTGDPIAGPTEGNDVFDGGNANVDDVVNGLGGDDIISGGTGDDTLLGGTGDDTLQGGDGHDQLDGGTGDDTLLGGTGDDTLQGGDGDNTLDGGDGNDTADYSDATAAVTVDLNAGTASGGAGNDTLTNIENVTGSANDDTITDDAGSNVLNAGAGDDTINYTGGSDTISGEDGNDTVIIHSGQNGDVVNVDGGSGIDTIDLTAFDANDVNDTGNQININLAGGGSFTINYSNVENIKLASPTPTPSSSSPPPRLPLAMDANSSDPDELTEPLMDDQFADSSALDQGVAEDTTNPAIENDADPQTDDAAEAFEDESGPLSIDGAETITLAPEPQSEAEDLVQVVDGNHPDTPDHGGPFDRDHDDAKADQPALGANDPDVFDMIMRGGKGAVPEFGDDHVASAFESDSSTDGVNAAGDSQWDPADIEIVELEPENPTGQSQESGSEFTDGFENTDNDFHQSIWNTGDGDASGREMSEEAVATLPENANVELGQSSAANPEQSAEHEAAILQGLFPKVWAALAGIVGASHGPKHKDSSADDQVTHRHRRR